MTERRTLIRAHRHDDGSVRLELRTGLLSPRRVHGGGPDVLRIALVATGATLLGGDQVELEVDLGSGVRLELVDVAATVAYHGRGQQAHWRTRLTVADGAVLVWDAHPLVVAAGARVHRSTVGEVAAGGRLLLRDTVALGRTRQEPGQLSCRTRLSWDGRPALAEDLLLDAAACRAAGITAGHRMIDSLTALGFRPSTPPHPDPNEPAVLSLAEPGALARDLVDEAHTSRLSRLWPRWHAASLG